MDSEIETFEPHQPGATTFTGSWATILRRSGFRRGGTLSLALNLLVIGAFGVLLPWVRGIDYLDPLVIFASSIIALLLAATASTDLVAAGETGNNPTSAILAAAVHGTLLLVLIHLAGILTLNFAYHPRRFLTPRPELLGAVLLFSITAGAFFAAFSAMLSVVFSPSAARGTIRTVFLAVLLGAYSADSWLPRAAYVAVRRQMTVPGFTRICLVGSAIAVVLAAGLLFALRRPRPREN